MPFYEYECSHCKFYSEVMQKISDPPLRKCPSCGRSTFRKLISAPVFRLKGSGWYETDFKSDKEGKRNLAGEDKPAESKSEEAGAKAAAKPADSKGGEGKAGEGKAGEGKGGDGKAADGKAAEGKAAEGKAAGSKRAGTAAGRRRPAPTVKSRAASGRGKSAAKKKSRR